MSITVATTLLLIAYMALILFFVIKGALKTKSLADFALGQGSSPLIVGLSLAASVTSAATFIINPGFVAMFGWSAFLGMSIVLPLGLFLSLIVMSKSFLKYGNSIKALTLAQWIGKRYDSVAYSRIIGFLSLLLITFIVLITVALVNVIAPALGASKLYVLIGLVVFVFGYMTVGGANTMLYSNAFQAMLMLVVAIIMIFSGWSYFSDGLDEFWNKLSSIDPLLVENYNSKSPLFRDFFEVVFCNFIIGIAIVCQPHIITKSLMLKSVKDVNKYLVIAIVLEIIFFSVLFAGFYARLLMPDLTVDGIPLMMDQIVSQYVLHEFSVGVGILVIFGLLAAGVSSLEGLIQSLSTTITNDIILSFTKKEISEKVKRNINTIVILVLAVVSGLFSYNQLVDPNLSVGIFAQNGVYAFFSSAFIPIIFGIFLKKVPKIAPMAATITAVVVYFGIYYGELSFYTTGTIRNPAVAGTYAILSSAIVGLLVLFINRFLSKNKRNNLQEVQK